jgi:hypothetical protein
MHVAATTFKILQFSFLPVEIALHSEVLSQEILPPIKRAQLHTALVKNLSSHLL